MRYLGLAKPRRRASLLAAGLVLLTLASPPAGVMPGGLLTTGLPLVGLSLAGLSSVHAQPGGGQAFPSGEYPSGPPAFEPSDLPIQGGYVFLDGEYIPPPYTIALTATDLTINGRQITSKAPQRSPYGWRGPGGGESFGRSSGYRGESGRMPPPGMPPPGMPPPSNPWRRWAFELPGELAQGCAVLAFRDQPLVRFDSEGTYNLLKSLTAVEGRAMRRVGLQEQLPAGFNAERWDEWISSYQPPSDLQVRAAAMIVNHETSAKKAQSEVNTARWVHQLEYPLTIGAMVVSVLAIGHLLGGRPHARQSTAGLDESPEMIHTLNWSLFFAVALSGLDLAWTILAAASGQMREVNPIGSHLIENPRHLAGFKIALTIAALGVLWILRRHKRAQIAAWWICLILTLVTVRWVTFSSMFLPPL